MNNKGLTIAELIIVIVIMGIITTFSLVGVSRYLSNAKLKVDKEVVTSLNKATTSYYLIGRNTPIFDESDTDEERMHILVTEGFLSNLPTPNTADAKFIWDQDLNLWYLSIDGEVSALSPYGSTPIEITSNIEKDIINHFNDTGSYGRTWGDYRFTDIGLTKEDWSEPIGHVYYTPSGSNIYLRPEDGYKFVMQTTSNESVTIKASHNWNLIYDVKTSKWFYHSINEDNEILISTLVIEPY